jgi:hypothetical protein
MSNCAVITTEKPEGVDDRLSVYVHWCGGEMHIRGFLKYCKMQHFRSPENDSYGWARLCQVIANYFGGTLSVGIDRYAGSRGDNGIYIIKDWELIGHEEGYSEGEQFTEEELNEFVKAIDERQPEHMRIWKSSENLSDKVKDVITDLIGK